MACYSCQHGWRGQRACMGGVLPQVVCFLRKRVSIVGMVSLVDVLVRAVVIGQFPPGHLLTGQLSPGQFPPRTIVPRTIPCGLVPPRTLPPGQFPPENSHLGLLIFTPGQSLPRAMTVTNFSRLFSVSFPWPNYIFVFFYDNKNNNDNSNKTWTLKLLRVIIL